MKENITFNSSQKFILVALRLLIGWNFLYEGISKLLIPDWSSAGFLGESKWIMKGFAAWIVSHAGVLNAVDFLNTWGLDCNWTRTDHWPVYQGGSNQRDISSPAVLYE